MQERDVAKFWEKGGIRLAFIGLEDQVNIHRAMPLRVIGYDGAAYRDELNKMKPGDDIDDGPDKAPLPFYPVITLVLHFDYERRWTAPRTLKECFPNVPPELDPYINDYRLHVFEIAWLPDETIQQFKSDFRFVADYYSQMRKNGQWNPMPGKVRHVKELFELWNALTNDKRFINMYNQRKGEQNEMTAIALDYLEKELAIKKYPEWEKEWEQKMRPQWEKKMRPQWEKEMRPQWEEISRDSTREENALAMFADHLPVEKVAQYSNLSLEKATALGKKHGYL